jgi:hypothetical protein
MRAARVVQHLGRDVRAFEERIGVTACVLKTCQHP